MFYKIASVEPLPQFVLRVSFQNGRKKIYDIKALSGKWPVFRDLETIPGLFPMVRVDMGGYGVSWNDDIDISCNELWENGKEDGN